MIKRERKFAMVSTEVAVGIALTVVALFVVLGLFGDNLSTLVANTKLGNVFNENSSKTEYNSFDRDYSDSQVNVQIMGEQGLQMLRRRANNKALEIIQESFSTSNSNANTIAYLSSAIKALTGESKICVFMKKDSDEHCDKLDGYSYNVELSGQKLNMSKVDVSGKTVVKTVTLSSLDSLLVATINSVPIKVDSATGKSLMSYSEKYSYIKYISETLYNLIRKDAILIRPSKTATSTSKTAETKAKTELVKTVTTFTLSLKDSVKNAHEECTTYGWLTGHDYDYSNGKSGCTGRLEHGLKSGSNTGFVDKDERNDFQSYVLEVNASLNSADNNATSVLNMLLNSGKLPKMIKIMRNDTRNNPTTCKLFKSGLEKIANDNDVKISIPECTPFDE